MGVHGHLQRYRLHSAAPYPLAVTVGPGLSGWGSDECKSALDLRLHCRRSSMYEM